MFVTVLSYFPMFVFRTLAMPHDNRYFCRLK